MVLTSPAFPGPEPLSANEHDIATALRLAISDVAMRAGAKLRECFVSSPRGPIRRARSSLLPFALWRTSHKSANNITLFVHPQITSHADHVG
jgi:hypothetical protein